MDRITSSNLNTRIFPGLVVFLILFAFGNSENTHAGGITTDKPVIGFSATSHDFGILESGSDASCYFVFTNTGTAPLIISNVRASCGCTVPEWPRSPVMKGGKDSLKVVFNTKSIRGSFNKTITVCSNSENGDVILNIKGNVLKKK